MSNSVSAVSTRKTPLLPKDEKIAQEQSNRINDPNRTYKGLLKPKFSDNKKRGAVVIEGEADSALYMGQDARYGTTLTTSGSGGDFSNKIVLGVGFINDKAKPGDQVDLSKPDLRYGAGLTIYQRTDTGKDAVFDKSNPKNTDRKATTRTPQKAVSVFEINADVVEVKARNGGVNIIAGYDPTLPNYGGDSERANTDAVGVSLIFGNYGQDVLNDRNSPFGLQPLVKGYNLTDRLTEMVSRISDITKVVNKIALAQQKYEIILASHTHAATLGVGPSIELAVATGIKAPVNIFNLLSSITATLNQAALTVNMSDISVAGINSKKNFTN